VLGLIERKEDPEVQKKPFSLKEKIYLCLI